MTPTSEEKGLRLRGQAYDRWITDAFGASVITRAQFETQMRSTYRVDVRTGEFERQLRDVRRDSPGRVPPSGDVVLPEWLTWDPGPASPVYGAIVEAFSDAVRRLGGLPLTKDLIFYAFDYVLPVQVTDPAVGVPREDDGASFSNGMMEIYAPIVSSDKWLPIGRSIPDPVCDKNPRGHVPGQCRYGAFAPTRPLTVEGGFPGAPIPFPTHGESAKRIVVHELGHSLAEAVLRVTPGVISDYAKAVGWTLGSRGVPGQLYDLGPPGSTEAAAAVAASYSPGSASAVPQPALVDRQITEMNWNSPRWSEQPVTSYTLANPSEDFAEAVMVFVYNQGLLQVRSPRRWKFITDGILAWRKLLLTHFPQVAGAK